MKILGSIRWLQIRLHVSLVSQDGALLATPSIYLAFSGYNKFFYGYRLVDAHRQELTMQSIYVYAPLSKEMLTFSPEFLSLEGAEKWCTYANLAKVFYGVNEKWLQNEFECEFYRWPFWACGSKPNIYNVSMRELDTIVRRCIRRIYRAKI
jgi:hypothetical protein